jgi:hypothetical protein
MQGSRTSTSSGLSAFGRDSKLRPTTSRLGDRYIETWYNRKERHSTLGYVSPVEYEMPFAGGRIVAITHAFIRSGQVHSDRLSGFTERLSNER